MYKKLLWIGIAVVSAMLSLAVVAFLSATASAAPSAIATSASPAGEGTPLPDYLIALPVRLPESAEIPAGLTPEQAADYARRLTYHQARPALAELERLRAEGKVAGFEVRPDLHSVAVEVTAPDALSRVQGAGAMLAKGDEPPACAAAAADALVEQVLGLSRAAALAPLAPQATDPSIDVYDPPGSTYTYVRGRTAFTATTVTMRILRRGQVIATRSTASNSGGYYYFYPSWQSCPTSGYNWTLQPGDVVEVTVGGNTVSTVVASLSAWVDPVANVVAGQTDAGRSAEVHLYHYGDNFCSSTHFSHIASTDGSGNFSADFTDQVDFNRMAYSTIYARDANGNSTYASFYAYRIYSRFGSSSIYGYLKPKVSFTATLSRPGSLHLVPYTGQSDADGYYNAWFGVEIQPGDIIHVSGGGVSMQYTATSLDVALDHTTDQAAGATGANRQVKAWFYKRDDGYYLQTSCTGGSHCASTIAQSSGSFTLPTTLDLARGDYASFYVYDAERHYQYSSERPVPAIVAEVGSRVMGYWGDPTAGYVTITIKSAGGVVKYTTPWGVWVDSWDGEFSDWPWVTIVPSDTIEVTDSAMTETMTVQNFSARLDGGTGHLAGAAYDDHLLATLWDFRRESGGWWTYCTETDVVSEAYDLTFSGAQVGGQDDGAAWNTGPDGHYTYRYFHAFAVNAEKGDDYVNGYSETPNTAVTITLGRGGNPLVVYTTTSQSSGYYYAYLSDVTPVTITQSDTVTVQTGDGDAVSVPIPELTANTDGADNRVYGRSPASEPVNAQVRRHYRYGWYGYSRNTAADASGDYSVNFDGLYWWRDCSAVDAGHACSQPSVDYYNAAGHHIWLEGPLPQPVGPDGYEDDDVYTSASAYVGLQSHTFHVVTDTDWVSFTVPAGDAGSAVYRIETLNLGWGMDTVLYLYALDGTTLIDSDDDGGEGSASLIVWTPVATGTYYVMVEPYSSGSTAYCDAVYDLEIFIVRAHIYLPLVIRNG